MAAANGDGREEERVTETLKVRGNARALERRRRGCVDVGEAKRCTAVKRGTVSMGGARWGWCLTLRVDAHVVSS